LGDLLRRISVFLYAFCYVECEEEGLFNSGDDAYYYKIMPFGFFIDYFFPKLYKLKLLCEGPLGEVTIFLLLLLLWMTLLLEVATSGSNGSSCFVL